MKRAGALLLCISLIFALASCGEAPTAALPGPVAPSAAAAAPAPTPTPEPLTVTLTLAGDLVMHEGLNTEARLPDGSYDYTRFFADVEPYISRSDYSLCCLESALTGGKIQSYPLFTSPDELAVSLRDVGFDLINTASNHALDGHQSGLIRTLDVLDSVGLDHVGTYRTQAEYDENNGILLREINGVSFAFLDYSYGTNGIPIYNFPYAVNLFNTSYMSNYVSPDYDKLAADMAAARALGTDIIAVSIHWGAEYQTEPSANQERVADFLFEQGADLVIGGHPHVPQPMELREVPNGDGTTRTGFLCYCLGNLLSTMKSDYTYLTAMVRLEITKQPATGETVISGCSYVPIMMVNLANYDCPDPGWQRQLWDIPAAIADYESGDDRGGIITPKLYDDLCRALADCERIFGPLAPPVRSGA
ncbi:MAG TPA: CapA family protein [Candidatus Scatomorpha merdipullorum]|uniref:CapA family protein n=1 Tax=Candidatus Scatomorpha merdipullorum TaxID=2840927 RepID=A0A9D1FD20_9FIRM|nr:CapA family protein [Candidatus Scatomorpha merdipullorum]